MNQKILLAAYHLSGGKEGLSFTQEALAVAVWKDFPKAIGLEGFEETYPDSNKVFSALSQKRGVIKYHGWMVRKNKIVSLTSLGLQAAKALLSKKPNAAVPSVVVSDSVVSEKKKPAPLSEDLPEEVCWLLDRLQVPVVAKFNGNIKTITRPDACQLWDVASFTTDLQLEKAFVFFDQRLRELEMMFDKMPGKIMRASDDRVVGMDDVRFLGNIHRQLKDAFEKKVRFT